MPFKHMTVIIIRLRQSPDHLLREATNVQIVNAVVTTSEAISEYESVLCSHVLISAPTLLFVDCGAYSEHGVLNVSVLLTER